MIAIALIFAALSFTLSASAGMGGSLILVPAMSLLLGSKHGIALSSLLLACNNVAKVIAYRSTIPFRAAFWVLLLTVIGAGLGAKLLIAAPERWIDIAIVISMISSFVFERIHLQSLQKASAPGLAFFAGATSGFSGTSGPLKGIALRNLSLDRLHLVGAASVISLAGDAMKSAIFVEASLLDRTSWLVLLGALPLMPLATLLGRRINHTIGERAYAGLFWAVMTGYSVRLLLF